MPCHGESVQSCATHRFPLPFQSISFLYHSIAWQVGSSLCHSFALPFYSVPLHNASLRIPFNALPAMQIPSKSYPCFSFSRPNASSPLPTARCLSSPCSSIAFGSSQRQANAFRLNSVPAQFRSFLFQCDSSLFRLELFFASPGRSDSPHFISLPQRIRLPGARRRSFHRSLCRHHPGSDT